MRNILLLTKREFFERIRSRGFISLAILGPIAVLFGIYMLFAFGGKKQQQWNVLITDPSGLLANKMMPKQDSLIKYSFVNQYIEIEEFRDAKKFSKFNAMLEVNEKVLSNKVAYLFYREKPSFFTSVKLQFQFERRLDEIMIREFTDLSIDKFRSIKQPINLTHRDVYDPKEESNELAGWAGYVFGILIFVFIFLYGTSILRSVSKDKANRVVEVILSSVKPSEFMASKILGIGFSAFVQFFLWLLIIGFGLFFMRSTLFPDIYDGATQAMQVTKEIASQEFAQRVSASAYNEFVELIFERLNYADMILWFCLFFIGGYLFYGSLFAALGALSGSETDGQQFNFLLIAFLCFGLFAGYHATMYPNDSFTNFALYFPFTSPIVSMVKLAYGLKGGIAVLSLSLFILYIFAIILIFIAGKLFKNGILHTGHRVSFKYILKRFQS